MKKKLLMMMCCLLMIISAGCGNDGEPEMTPEEPNTSTEDDRDSPCFEGIIAKVRTDGYISVWLGENPDKNFSDFSLCYIAFHKSDLPYREYKEGDHIFFKILKHGEAYEDYKEGLYFAWGIYIRYNCIVKPCD